MPVCIPPARLASLILPVLGLSACVSMDAVQEYANYTRQTVDEVRPVARDFYRSCLRMNSYKPWNATSPCDLQKSAAAEITNIARILDAYGTALGELAADETVSFDQRIGRLKQEVREQNVSELDDRQLNALESLANLVSRAATDGYRQKKIAAFISAADRSVQNVSETLADLIRNNYSEAIRQEMTAWKSNYRNIERDSRTSQPLEWERYAREQWALRARLQERLAAVDRLAESIRNIGATHAALALDASRLSAAEVHSRVRAFVNQARPVIQEVQDAF